ncbi:hypothetical protein [Burkholderia sp. ABCPW 14]|uniref:hypothetical protein n=1 Tax=Burkholderia sp. ABCPW 14 TaxID=1637860 RepID=UPI000B230BFA|nr:hypothetical protein [Burkholderia sp. ABCPW 14]
MADTNVFDVNFLAAFLNDINVLSLQIEWCAKHARDGDADHFLDYWAGDELTRGQASFAMPPIAGPESRQYGRVQRIWIAKASHARYAWLLAPHTGARSG